MGSCPLGHEAYAQGPKLEYRAPDACPSAEAFEARVAQTLQRSLEDVDRPGRFEVTIEPTPGGYQLTVSSEVRGQRGFRALSAPDCESVADAGALSVAMALSAASGAEEVDRPSDHDAPSPAPPVPPTNRDPARSPRAPAAPAESSRETLALHLLGDYGALPRVAPGLRVNVGRSSGRWSAHAGIGALLPVSRWVDGRRGAVGGRFWLGAGRAEGCLRAAGGAEGSLHGCLVLEAGALTGSGLGVDVPKRDTLVWLAPGARVAGAWPLMSSRAHAVAGVEAVVPLLTQRFTVENGSTDLHRPARSARRVDLGVAWQF